MNPAIQTTPANFDAAFSDLLRAFNAHEDNRASHAGHGELARSSQTLFNARMAMHSVNR